MKTRIRFLKRLVISVTGISLIATGCMISSGAAGVVIGDDTLIGPGVAIMAANRRYSRSDVPIREQGHTSKGVKIGRDVLLGAGVVEESRADVDRVPLSTRDVPPATRNAPAAVAVEVVAFLLEGQTW